MKPRQIADMVKTAIYGYHGRKKWRIANGFALSLTDAQRVRFAFEFTKMQRSIGKEAAMYRAEETVGSRYGIAAHLAAPPQYA